MKVAILTDQHFGARNDSINFLDFYDKFYTETFFPKLIEEKITVLLILGDTYDRRKYVNFQTLERSKQMFFDKLYNMGIQVHVLAGNHDTFYKNTNSVNSVKLLLREYNNVNVIDHPATLHLGDNNQYRICMMPWICTENFDDSMLTLKDTDAKICMGHFEIVGFGMNRNMKSEEGLGRDIFKRFDVVFSGHYHHKSSDDNIQYLGNPYELTWEDYNDDRGFHLFDLSNNNLEFIKNPNVMFYRIEYDDTVECDYDFEMYRSKYVKVIVINKTNPNNFDIFLDMLHEVNPIDISIIEDFTDLTENVNDDEIENAENTITIINKVIGSIEVDNINNAKLMKFMNEIYVEALNMEKT